MGMGMGGGKGGGASGQAPQIDPKQSIEQFQKAAQVIRDEYPAALDFMQTAMTQGTQAAYKLYGEAEQQALPFSSASQAATKELRFMLGLPEMDPLEGTASKLDTLAKTYSANSGKLVDSSGKDMNVSEQTKIIKGTPSSSSGGAGTLPEMKHTSGTQVQIKGMFGDRAQQSAGTPDQVVKWTGGTEYSGETNTNYINSAVSEARNAMSALAKSTDPTERAALQQKALSAIGLANERADQVVRGNTGAAEAPQIREMQSQLRGIQEEIQQGFKGTLKTATADEIRAKLEATPGYMFQRDQGQQALERQAAKAGMFASGNALIAATEYGQKFAQTAYQGQIQNLQNLAQSNLPLVQQQIASKQQQAGLFAGRADQYGAVTQQSMQDVAKASAGAYNNSGNAYLQAATANAQMQNQRDIENAKMEQAAQQSMFSSFGSLAKMF